MDTNVLADEDILRTGSVAAAMVLGFHSTILHLVRKPTDSRRETRNVHTNTVARMSHQRANLMD
eukprot:9086651-Alexandrium_andersonii.AAC.1